ncbi:hypothetical protein M5D96_005047 [Drosophila gunungcola]|uniref:Uncharacterized protein n=1 Tax=Drosophila gunungcola TaxID=103775 RepID=A0A9P9YW16_9MUSC|nr:hypothetical protein M5D96_005047 [Drosophila gunungcola]
MRTLTSRSPTVRPGKRGRHGSGVMSCCHGIGVRRAENSSSERLKYDKLLWLNYDPQEDYTGFHAHGSNLNCAPTRGQAMECKPKNKQTLNSRMEQHKVMKSYC